MIVSPEPLFQKSYKRKIPLLFMLKGWSYRILLGLIVIGGGLFVKNYEEILKAKFSLGEMDVGETMMLIGALLFFALLVGAIILTIKTLWHKLKSR